MSLAEWPPYLAQSLPLWPPLALDNLQILENVSPSSCALSCSQSQVLGAWPGSVEDTVGDCPPLASQEFNIHIVGGYTELPKH